MMHTPPKYLASFDLGAHSPSELPSQPGQIWHPLSCDSHSFTGVGGAQFGGRVGQRRITGQGPGGHQVSWCASAVTHGCIHQLSKRKGSPWLPSLQVLVHGWLNLLPQVCGEAINHDGSSGKITSTSLLPRSSLCSFSPNCIPYVF